ncbi:glycosyltransferase family 2 protein [Flavobacterium sp. SUN052]|uniref:glycosyltransferase family 2 protein n=1 Tax=Flavobacterium sp. SUN052 TaxID=3002441 RepID=UPI00237EE80E|nr:glycosyltransferase family 2 protein [Flavobacterium sp. SUN052]MEC4005365.1 glycosyltransferase family 2 protein [Flavobacterium sp. SUN052]
MSENNAIPKITALAITFNEEENVKRYVESLSFADEIIFVDSISTDKTLELAKEMNVKVITRKFTNFSDQRNYAISQAKNDWIVFFDLDEIITKELEQEIRNTVLNSKSNAAFFVKRNFFFMGKRIRFGGWQNDKAIRLFNKNLGQYNGNLVHEEIKTSGSIGILKNRLNHYSYKNFDNYNDKLNLYSNLQAKNLYQQNKKPNAYHLILRPLYRFIWQYLFRLGFLDGKEGFILAYVHSFSVFKRYLQLWMMYRKID